MLKKYRILKGKAWSVCRENDCYLMKDGMVFCSEHGRFSSETAQERNGDK